MPFHGALLDERSAARTLERTAWLGVNVRTIMDETEMDPGEELSLAALS
jgi:hypothetical protein